MAGEIKFATKNLEPIADYSIKDMEAFMNQWNTAKVKLFVEKDTDYGGSWMRDGLIGAFFNLKRKMDRIVARFKAGKLTDMANDTTNESNIDTFMDLENYSCMNIGFMFFTADEATFKVFCNRIAGLDTLFTWDSAKRKPVRINNKQHETHHKAG